jgi:hypothetical protein
MGAVVFTHPLWGGRNFGINRNEGIVMRHLHVLDWNNSVTRAALDGPRKLLQRQRGPHRKCRVEAAAIGRKVANAAALEAFYQPPAESVRAIKAAFSPATRYASSGPLQLLYDTFSHPAPAGTRSSSLKIRQLLYRADPYQIDIHIELQPERNRFLVTGQIVDLSHADLVARDVKVTLSDGRDSIVNSVTNEFGEFRGEVENSGDLEISLVTRGGKPIVILLRGALEPFANQKE